MTQGSLTVPAARPGSRVVCFAFCVSLLSMMVALVIEGAMTGEMFLAYVEQCLVPTLRRNDIVVMDNCRVHMAPAIGEAIEKARATLRYLPKYFPDLNPIEMPYSKFKTPSAKWQRDPFRASCEQFARSSHNSALANVPTISVMQGMLQYAGIRFSTSISKFESYAWSFRGAALRFGRPRPLQAAIPFEPASVLSVFLSRRFRAWIGVCQAKL
jgi:transposase